MDEREPGGKESYALLSVNVGMAQTGTFKGKPARSGIVKSPVDGAVVATANGLAGDEQADLVYHGGPDKAACVYSFDHYVHWENVLGRTLPYGAFGENFTFGGIRETDFHIGDIFRLGAAVVQVSQPRQPCWKLAMRWGLDELPLLVTQAGATGFYFRVLEPGEVRAGDALRPAGRHAAGISVAEANRVMHADKNDLAGIERLLAVDELSGSWRATLSKRAANLRGSSG